MKKTDWFILIATAAYSYLFYEQSAGINFLIFSILLVLFSSLKNPKLITKSGWLAITTGSVLSGFAIFYYGDSIAIPVNILSLTLLAAFSFSPSSSIFIAFLQGCYSFFTAAPSFLINRIRQNQSPGYNTHSVKRNRILLLIIPLLITALFFVLYRASNPLFEKITNKISLDFVSFYWFAFTGSGMALIYIFFHQRAINWLISKDEASSDQLSVVSEEQHSRSFVATFLSLSNELFTGITLLTLLNLLLLAANGIDIYFLYILQKLPAGLTLSQYLHDGTGALIYSISLAVAILLFFFRGRLNFIENNKLIKLLAYVWIVQNTFMVFTTCIRNWQYINEYNLTYKRIGVYVFLFLCLAGLITTFIKILRVQSSWFMSRKNAWIWYSTLIISCFVNWDGLIASYNLRAAYQKPDKFDASYILNLSYSSLPAISDIYEKEKDNPMTKVIFSGRFISVLSIKHKRVIENMNVTGWPSICIIKAKIEKQFSTSLRIVFSQPGTVSNKQHNVLLHIGAT